MAWKRWVWLLVLVLALAGCGEVTMVEPQIVPTAVPSSTPIPSPTATPIVASTPTATPLPPLPQVLRFTEVALTNRVDGLNAVNGQITMYLLSDLPNIGNLLGSQGEILLQAERFAEGASVCGFVLDPKTNQYDWLVSCIEQEVGDQIVRRAELVLPESHNLSHEKLVERWLVLR